MQQNFNEVPWLAKQNGDSIKSMLKERMKKKYLETLVAHSIMERLCSRHKAKCFCGIIYLTLKINQRYWWLSTFILQMGKLRSKS